MDVDSGTARSATSPLPGPNTVPDLIAAARRGCPTSLGQVFEALRAQLIAIANEELPDGLRAKVGPSDLVQETAIDMQRNFDQFRGTTAEECFAWLRSILRNNVVDAVRHFQATRKRDLACDRLPEGSAIRHEDAAVVSRLLARLPPEQGRVIELRYWRSLSFAEIGAEMNRSTDAVRKLWYRALERLQAELAADRGAVAGQPDAAVTQRL
jgi:RNA polymerase sigma-70 factor (ECF subfamily)